MTPREWEKSVAGRLARVTDPVAEQLRLAGWNFEVDATICPTFTMGDLVLELVENGEWVCEYEYRSASPDGAIAAAIDGMEKKRNALIASASVLTPSAATKETP